MLRHGFEGRICFRARDRFHSRPAEADEGGEKQQGEDEAARHADDEEQAEPGVGRDLRQHEDAEAEADAEEKPAKGKATARKSTKAKAAEETPEESTDAVEPAETAEAADAGEPDASTDETPA